MTQITLPPDLESRLASRAVEQGTTLELLALECLNKHFPAAIEAEQIPEGESLYDFLAGYVGVVEGTGENVLDDPDRLLTDYLVEKHRRIEP